MLSAAAAQAVAAPTEAALASYRRAFAAAAESLSGAEVGRACDIITAAQARGQAVFACGNGGSAATASHFSEDLAKLLWRPERGERLRAMALTDATACITALANDDGYDRVFEIQLAMQAAAGDVLVAISGSGQSANVLAAARWARSHDMPVVTVTGYDGGRLAPLGDARVHVDCDNMGMLEGVHMLALDFISKEVRHRAFGTPHAER